MTNANKFKGIFGIYATELWAKPEKEFLEWLNEDVPDTNVGDTISRQEAMYIKVSHGINEDGIIYVPLVEVINHLKNLPSAQPEIVRCKDCKNFRRWVNTDIAFCDRTETNVSSNDFCSRAERYEDDPSHPFADDVMMKGEEDETD